MKCNANKQNEASLAFNTFFKELLKKSIWYWQNYGNFISIKWYSLFSIKRDSTSQSQSFQILSHIKIGYSVFTSSCRRFRPSHGQGGSIPAPWPGWIYLSSCEVTSKTLLALKAKGREEFIPTFDCKRKEAALAARVLTYSAWQGVIWVICCLFGFLNFLKEREKNKRVFRAFCA